MAAPTLMQSSPYQFDLSPLQTATDAIRTKYPFDQIGLTHSAAAANVAPTFRVLEGTGWAPGAEGDFTHFNEEFKDTYLHRVWMTLSEKRLLGRCRILTMKGPSCYSVHSDLNKRWHLAIHTQENCWMWFPKKDTKFVIPADGKAYLLDTRYSHTFVNGSRGLRVHLVMEDLGPK